MINTWFRKFFNKVEKVETVANPFQYRIEKRERLAKNLRYFLEKPRTYPLALQAFHDEFLGLIINSEIVPKALIFDVEMLFGSHPMAYDKPIRKIITNCFNEIAILSGNSHLLEKEDRRPLEKLL